MKRELKETTAVLQGLAAGIDILLNGDGPKEERANGFVLLVFPFGEAEGQRTNYVSNCRRKDIIAALKEVVARFEGQGQAEVKGKA